ncbi:MAG: DUF5677 domain-containing protein [Candidatus Eremiobacteraeota bacterium]|nr:DUF5677 domain-containing protein [Candidatus Eremiobacteraeota bacterium]
MKNKTQMAEEICDRLLDVSQAITQQLNGRRMKWETENEYYEKHMVTFFIYRQIDTLMDILILLEEERPLSASILARHAFEGLAQLNYALHEEKADKWCKFGYMEDYYKMIDNEEFGIKCPDNDRREIIENYNQIKGDFLTKKGGYHKEWYGGVTYKDMFGLLPEKTHKGLHYRMYKDLCNIAHFNPHGLAAKMERKNDKILYTNVTKEAKKQGDKALMLGFTSLLASLRAMDFIENLGHKDKIDELEKTFFDIYEVEMDKSGETG